MGASDRVTTSFADVDLEMTLYGGSPSTEFCVVQLAEAGFSYTVETPPFAEVRHRNKHLATPAVRNTGSGNVTGSVSAKIASFKGSTAASLKEVLEGSGLAASWSSTGNGDRKMKKLKAVFNDGDVSQTVNFAYCVFSNVQINSNGADGLATVTADFTDFEDFPAVT